MTEDIGERRNGLRVDFNTKLLISAGTPQVKYVSNSKDISLRGVFLFTEDVLEINSKCDIEIQLSGTLDDLVLYLKGHVVRKEEKGYAIFFDSVDLNSYTHLKNIVKYNSPDE